MILSFTVNLSGAAPANTDESRVPEYVLPDPLVDLAGRPVATAEAWTGHRRAEVLRLFADHVYGNTPATSATLSFVVRSEAEVLGGLGRRKEVTVYPLGRVDGPSFDLLLFFPAQARGPVPVFLGLNFRGNHTVAFDPGIRLSDRWMPDDAEHGVVNHRATEAGRGTSASRWAIEKILKRGYGLATAYCGDFEPDHAEGWKTGVRAVLSPDGAGAQWKAGDWGCIGAWAWGLSRAMDYLELDPDMDARHVALMGHSRLGKTALWAGAQDERFAIVISNDSGEGGAALARRRFGETTAIINRAFPHWFCGRFKDYGDREDALPVDQHMLIALMAPRPAYIASAEEDSWADPRGEFLSAKHASPVYELLGLPGLGVLEMPGIHQPVGQTVGYHIRAGKHDVTDYDWTCYLDFADRHWGKGGRS